VKAAIAAEVGGALNKYPDPLSNAVRDRLALRFSLERGNFLVGNGGDDILTIVTRCLVGESATVAYPDPTYILYETLARLQGAKTLEVPFGKGFSLPEALFGNKAALTFLANPNSPSGTVVSPERVADLAGSLAGVLLVDEAYVDFAERNCMHLVGRLPNVCVLRSFSKSFSLAGMRLGYLAAPAELIRQFMKAKDSYNVNRLSMAAAAAALDDYDYMLSNVARVKKARRQLVDALGRLGFDTLPSQANFVWTRVPSPGAKVVYEALKARRILVRFWDRPGMSDYLRITVGTPEEMEALVTALEEITGGGDAV
jgi:histidinol-phosphate aminotransferase